MPFSNIEQISPILAEITRLNPRSILDVGCGLGLYGLLCRIHLDLYHDPEFYRKLDGSHPWDTRIDGIEGCEIYTSFIPHWVYDNIQVGNAMDIIPNLTEGQYDLILILAMIEHLDQEEGIQLITQLKRVGRNIILSVPKNWQEQRIEGYPLETHRSHWTEQDLRNAGFTRFLPHWGAWLAVYGIPSPPQPTGDTANNAIQISGSFDQLSDKLDQIYANYSKIGSQMDTLNETIEQIKCNLATLLINQQVIFDRLSITSRFQSLGRRLHRMFTRNHF